MIEARAACRLPIMAMIRPREGEFTMTSRELATAERDVALMAEHGADGFVFGVLTEDHRIDRAGCSRLLKACSGKPALFHRAFDRLDDLDEGIGVLRELGFARMLSSGGRASAEEGVDTLAKLGRAGGIEVMPGGGIRSANVRRICEQTGCGSVHMGPRAAAGDYRALDVPEVEKAAKILRGLA